MVENTKKKRHKVNSSFSVSFAPLLTHQNHCCYITLYFSHFAFFFFTQFTLKIILYQYKTSFFFTAVSIFLTSPLLLGTQPVFSSLLAQVILHCITFAHVTSHILSAGKNKIPELSSGTSTMASVVLIDLAFQRSAVN